MEHLTQAQDKALAEILSRAERIKKLGKLHEYMQRTQNIAIHAPGLMEPALIRYDEDRVQYVALSQIVKDLIRTDQLALAELVKEPKEG